MPPPPPLPTTALREPTLKKPWYRRTWVWITAAAVIGIGVGAASHTDPDPTTSAPYKALHSQYAALQDHDQQQAANLASASASIATLTAQVGDIPSEKASIAAAKKSLTQRDAKLAAAQLNLQREQHAVSRIRDTILATTVAGNGTYHVGQDMTAGTYHSSGNSECYWQISSDANGNDIIANNNVTGPAFVSVVPGQYFESQDCSPWIKQ